MTIPRMLVMALLVVMLTLMPIATATAQASGLDAAQDFAYYLWQYFAGESQYSTGE